MYDRYYNFAGRPFQRTPDPRFYFESLTHRKAMSYLGYGLAQGEGVIVITGDVGAGKTTLVGHLMATIDPQRLTAAKIVSTQVDADNLLRLTALSLGLRADEADRARLLSCIEAFLHQQARAGRRTLLIIDEAQRLGRDALEELWMLSNVQLGGQALLQIFLLGQPEFRDKISGAEELEQIRQRLIATHHLERMRDDEVGAYIEHRLKVVGWTGNPRFTSGAYALLARSSGGLPRRLNALVSRVLLLGAIDHLETIDERLVETVIAASGSERPSVPSKVNPVGVQGSLSDREALTDSLQALTEDVRALDSATGTPEMAAPALAGIEERLARAEARIEEQDEVLRRVLARLIEWVEREDGQGPLPNRAA